MKTQEEVHSELCMLYSRRDTHSHSWARGELASQSLLDDIWGKIYALRWVLDKNIQWGVANQTHEKGEAGHFEKWPLTCYCYPGCELPKAAPAPASDGLVAELEQAYAEAAPVLWGVDIGTYDDVLIFEDVNGNGIRPNPYHPICRMEDMGDEKQEAYAVLIKSTVNALPSLLARAKGIPKSVVEIEADIKRLLEQKQRNLLGREALLKLMQEQPARRAELEQEYAGMKRRAEDYDIRIQALEWVLAV